jgi:N-acetylglucosaminyldiphosphoundecaprenol N-acetyl-beta-D-mannosaminyltransferase
VKILGVKVDNIDLKQAIRKVERWLKSGESKIFTIVTPNPEIVVQAQRDKKLRKILNSADLAIPDGVGLVWASRLLSEDSSGMSFFSTQNSPPDVHRGRSDSDLSNIPADKDNPTGNIATNTIQSKNDGWPQSESSLAQTVESSKKLYPSESSYSLGENLGEAGIIDETAPGVKLMEELCRVAAEKGWGVGLYGGRGKVAEKALDKLQKEHPKLKGWFCAPPELKITQLAPHVRGLMSKILRRKTRLLFIGLGAPKQEYLIKAIYDLRFTIYDSIVVMGVGGAFDEISGRVRPAPAWVSRIGIKWFWRLFWQPWRLKRQLRLIKFIYLVIREKYLT